MAYKYRTFRPPAHRMRADETPEHRFAYTQRTDPLARPSDRCRYHARCTCGWSESTQAPWSAQHVARTRWKMHLAIALRQGQLPV